MNFNRLGITHPLSFYTLLNEGDSLIGKAPVLRESSVQITLFFFFVYIFVDWSYMTEPVLRKPVIHENISELLESNKQFKNETISEYRNKLNHLKEGYANLLDKEGVDKEKLKLLDSKIDKLEKLITFYENRPW